MRLNRFIKQREHKGVGAFFNLLYLCLPVLGMFSYVGVGLTTYATFIVKFIPWFPFWLYIVAIILGSILVLLLFWVFVYKGYFQNPIGQDVKAIKTMMESNNGHQQTKEDANQSGKDYVKEA